MDSGREPQVELSHRLPLEMAPREAGGICLDPVTGKLFVADSNGRRVLRFSTAAAKAAGAPPEAVLGQADLSSSVSDYSPTQTNLGTPTDVAFQDGTLWVADPYNGRVLRFDNAASKPNGAPADSVLGQSDFVSHGPFCTADGMTFPNALAIDAMGRLFVADSHNHRVLRFENARQLRNGAAATAVFGQPNFIADVSNDSRNGFRAIDCLAVKNLDRGVTQLWVGDRLNCCVVCYDNAHTHTTGGGADGVLGQPGLGLPNPTNTPIETAFTPTSMTFDNSGHLYVGDNRWRIFRYDSPSPAAHVSATSGVAAIPSAVLGQPDFSTIVPATEFGESGGYSVSGLAVGLFGELWVADRQRIGMIPNPLTADLFTAALGGASFAQYGRPLYGAGVAVDPVTGKVFVSDREAGMVRRFASFDSLQSHDAAELSLSLPGGLLNSVFVDKNGTLYIIRADSVWMDAKAGTKLGDDLTLIVGSMNTHGCSATLLFYPTGVCADGNGSVWVADRNNHRVCYFKKNAAGAYPLHRVIGQPNATTNSPVFLGGTHTLREPAGVCLDSAGRLYIADSANHRIIRYDAAASQPANKPAFSGVLGQDDFTGYEIRGWDDGLGLPTCVASDAVGRLWIGDDENNRVVRCSKPTLPAAKWDSTILGQDSFWGDSVHIINQVNGLAVDPHGCVWVATMSGAMRFIPDDPILVTVFFAPSPRPGGLGTLKVKVDVEPGVFYSLKATKNNVHWYDLISFTAQSPQLIWEKKMPASPAAVEIVGP